MIGRAAIGYPWIFREIKHYLTTGTHHAVPTIQERVDATRKHFDFSVRWKGPKLGVFEMRRHYASYFKSLPDFKPFRTQLVEAPTPDDVYMLLDQIAETYTLSLV
jgi:tRNA-dihydrouridine synthase